MNKQFSLDKGANFKLCQYTSFSFCFIPRNFKDIVLSESISIQHSLVVHWWESSSEYFWSISKSHILDDWNVGTGKKALLTIDTDHSHVHELASRIGDHLNLRSIPAFRLQIRLA